MHDARMLPITMTTTPVRNHRTLESSKTFRETNHNKVAVIGLGYVGLPFALLAEKQGFDVVGFDIDIKKIADLKLGKADYVTEEELQWLKHAKRFTPTHNKRELSSATIHIVCVPTPVHEDHEPDLTPLKGACTIVGRVLKKGDLVIIESTVNPGACETVALPILEKNSGMRGGTDFLFAHCPERINPGDTKWNVRTIPRVLGGLTRESADTAHAFYSRIIEGEIQIMPSIKEAEAVKMVENAFRDINIAFVNELAMSFDKAGIDLVSVLKGASSKPFAFMAHFPGCGVGGHCIPVDPYYLIRYGEENGFEHHFLRAARQINSAMPAYTVGQLARALRARKKKLGGARVALLGLAYKKDIPDVRESPSLVIRELLQKRGAHLRVYDPHVIHESTHTSVEETLRNVDAVLIATDHREFKSLTPYHFMRMGIDIVIDGRNCLSKKDFKGTGIIYRGIGR